jgi:hypothetical protein
MDYNIKKLKYKLKLQSFIGGAVRQEHFKIKDILPKTPSNIIYVNSTTNKKINTLPLVDIWKKKSDGNDVWYKNINTQQVEWLLPPNSWYRTEIYINKSTNTITDVKPDNQDIWEYILDLDKYKNLNTNKLVDKLPPNSWEIKYQYQNSTTKLYSISIPLSDIWYTKHDDTDIWYVNRTTGKSEWLLPPNSWLEQTLTIPKYIYEDLELYNTQGAGLSDDIWPIITDYYNIVRKNLQLIGRFNKLNLFSIIPNNVGNKYEPLLGKGTYTAVYMIKDIHLRINDDSTKYILRIYIRDYNFTTKNMFDYDKVKYEFALFQDYMAKIYFYGSLYKSGDLLYIIKDRLPFDYNITKIYNTLSDTNIRLLSNQQKIKFLLQNIKMLNILASHSYIHMDYKIDNIAYENPDLMNVILIDYDITTLQKLIQSNSAIKFNTNNTVSYIDATSTYLPKYINDALPLSKWDKYSIGGLINIIDYLDIKFNFVSIKIPPDLSNGKINTLNVSSIIYDLKLEDYEYDNIPTYEELYNIFDYLNINGSIM